MSTLKNKKYTLGNEMNYLEKIIQSEDWSATSGSVNAQLEEMFAKKFNSKYAVAFNSGTATLHAALLAVGVSHGDEVISPAFSVMFNTTTTLHANAIPVYADVDPDTFNIDPKDIEKKITDKTKAIQLVSIYGLPPDMDEIMEISEKHNIPVIEDNAECFLGYYKDRLAGTFGAISSFSFESSKHISCGEGGIITTDNEEYAKMCRKIGGQGFRVLTAEEGRIKLDQDIWQNPNFKRHDTLGWNYRLSEFSAAIALAQLERLEELVNLRQESARIFLSVINDCNFLIPQFIPEHSVNSYWALGVKYLGEEMLGISWYDFRMKYIENGGDGIYGAWKVPYKEPLIEDNIFKTANPELYNDLHYPEGLCPIAEEIQKNMMVFKTNYRDLSIARKKAEALAKTIKYFS